MLHIIILGLILIHWWPETTSEKTEISAEKESRHARQLWPPIR